MNKKIINAEKITEAVIDLIYKSSFSLPFDVAEKFKELTDREENGLARHTLQIINENTIIAKSEELPLCQDCGVVIAFIEIGFDVIIEGNINDAINEGVEIAYKKFNLRKSIVKDPLKRINNGTNTPAFIHIDMVPGNNIKITIYLKGGGSENMTALNMFKPTDPYEKIIDYIEEVVVNAGPNPCPPIFLGIGIGGTADIALLNSKKAVLRGIGTRHPDPFYSNMEILIEERLNKTNIGPLGFGGNATTGGVFIKEAPTHIATLPVALNLNCHSLRYKGVEI